MTAATAWLGLQLRGLCIKSCKFIKGGVCGCGALCWGTLLPASYMAPCWMASPNVLAVCYEQRLTACRCVRGYEREWAASDSSDDAAPVWLCAAR